MSLSEKAKLFGKEWQEMSKQQKDEFYTKACEAEELEMICGSKPIDCSVKSRNP